MHGDDAKSPEVGATEQTPLTSRRKYAADDAGTPPRANRAVDRTRRSARARSGRTHRSERRPRATSRGRTPHGLPGGGSDEPVVARRCPAGRNRVPRTRQHGTARVPRGTRRGAKCRPCDAATTTACRQRQDGASSGLGVGGAPRGHPAQRRDRESAQRSLTPHGWQLVRPEPAQPATIDRWLRARGDRWLRASGRSST